VSKNLKRVVLWVPGLFDSNGGIQNYLKSLISAFECIIGGENLHVFSKNDKDLCKLQQFSRRVNWYILPFNHSLSSYKFAYNCLLQTLRIRPDLIICGHLNFSKAFYPLTFNSKVKTWLLCYGFECWDVKDYIKKQTLRSVTSTISISNFTREKIILNHCVEAASAYILPVSFDEEKFNIIHQVKCELRKKLGIPEKSKIILTVSRLSSKEKYKGYDTILHLMPKLILKHPSIVYLIVGKGDDTQRIIHLVRELKIETNVFLVGFVDDKELASYYNACDIFCMPSTAEGFGIVFLEALACGKVVIGGKVDGTRDALNNGELGFLVDPYDTEKIYKTILMALDRTIPHRLAFFPERLRTEVIQKYGSKSFLNTLKSILYDHGWRTD
jgi:phosphatidylinositol alpha-1,6-mannosyltransferase